MSDVIRFLENLGRNPLPLGEGAFTAAVMAADLSPESKRALLQRDIEALNREVGGRGFMLCLIYQPDNDDQPGREEPDDTEETPDQQPEARVA